jgi:membrane protein YdbS with pleckstrin-like domain
MSVLRRIARELKKPESEIRLYVLTVVIVTVIIAFASAVSSALPSVSSEVAASISESVIRLDGVLFGFSATMFSIVYLKQGSKKPKKLMTTVSAFILVAFWSFLISIVLAFSNLWFNNNSSLAFAPVILTFMGGVFCSIYIVMTIFTYESSEPARADSC